MTEYELVIQQLVEYPRCRLYRPFVYSLIKDLNIRTDGGLGLFHYVVLSCYASDKMSYRREGEFNYTIHPGEGLCTIDETVSILRVCNRKEALAILEDLQRRHLISFNILSNGCCVKYMINDWQRFNRVHENTAHCHKKSEFFFVPTTLVSEIIGTRQASEMDVVLDLWINAVYADDRV